MTGLGLCTSGRGRGGASVRAPRPRLPERARRLWWRRPDPARRRGGAGAPAAVGGLPLAGLARSPGRSGFLCRLSRACWTRLGWGWGGSPPHAGRGGAATAGGCQSRPAASPCWARAGHLPSAGARCGCPRVGCWQVRAAGDGVPPPLGAASCWLRSCETVGFPRCPHGPRPPRPFPRLLLLPPQHTAPLPHPPSPHMRIRRGPPNPRMHF